MFLRLMQILLLTSGYGVLLGGRWCYARVRKTAPPSEWGGNLLVCLCESLGGAFLKAGQILSTRQDFFPAHVLRPLQRLQDQIRPFPASKIPGIIKQALGREVMEIYSDFDFQPLASASIAQVHRAKLRSSGKEVAVKIRRPGIVFRYQEDLQLMTRMLPLLKKLPGLTGLPLKESLGQVAEALLQQTDFGKEAENNKRFQELFADSPAIKLPCLVEDLCTNEILTMEYLEPLTKVDSPKLSPEQCQAVIIKGLEALYRMIFVAGFFHCDLHPGNFFCGKGNQLIILDTGFVAELKAREKALFREFFLAIAFNEGKTCAQILIATALGKAATFDQAGFEQEISQLIDRNSRLCAEEFQVSDFVASLFTVQRKYQLYGSSAFTMAILSLLVYEGITKKCYPELDFQQAAIPYLRASKTQTSGA